MEMRVRLVLSGIVLLALAANQPCLAKEAHARHGAITGAAEKSGTKGANAHSANPTGTKSLDFEATAPSVLPPHGMMPQRHSIPSVKIVRPTHAAHSHVGSAVAPAARNAIGQTAVQSKNLVAAPLHLPPTLQAPRIVPPQIVHSTPGALPPVPFNAVRPNAPAVNAAILVNRSSSTAGVIRPGTPPSGIGGAARPSYGINGTAVQRKH
jgi:hypothetical protein